jgi:hypothetical protein
MASDDEVAASIQRTLEEGGYDRPFCCIAFKTAGGVTRAAIMSSMGLKDLPPDMRDAFNLAVRNMNYASHFLFTGEVTVARYGGAPPVVSLGC